MFLKAKMAVSERARQSYQEQLVRRYQQMANSVAGEVAGRIISDSSKRLAADRAAKIGRLKTASTKQPDGAGVPQKATVPDLKNNRNPQSVVEWQRGFDQLFGGS